MITTPEEKIVATRNLLNQAEAQHAQTITLVRKALGEIEDDVRELRREEVKRTVEFFTEEQLAERVGISRSTVKRLREAGQLVPCNVGGPLRYSSFHVEQLARVPAESPRSDRRRRHPHLTSVTQERKQA